MHLLNLSVLLLLLTSLSWLVLASEDCQTWAGRLVSVQGLAEVKRAGQKTWQRQFLGAVLCPGDSLRLGAHSRADVLLNSEIETTLRLDENTGLNFTADEPRTLLDLIKGAIHFISRTPRPLDVRTPYVNAGIEGTEFLVRVDAGETRVWVFEGVVRASNSQGSLRLSSGQLAIAKAGQAPLAQPVIKPRDAVQWALYYPALIDVRAVAARVYPDRADLRNIIDAYQRGDLMASFAALESVPTTQRDRHYYCVQAVLLLTVGRVEEAHAAIRRALELSPRWGPALALEAIIALVHNDPERSLHLARQATVLAPESVSPWIALSYAYQGLFDLEQALSSAERAVDSDDQDALAWARVAELRLAQGDLKASLAAAEQAVNRNPGLARVHTVLGFAHLAQIEVEQARSAFEQAIVMDQADPLPRLGLGLILIRHGELREGREQIAIAVSLDANNSLLRSYLGKAYYEEKRDRPAAKQLSLAQELDPRDPTPWYYSAILKQSLNNPVAAVQDLQQSIQLNDNRAVYRSRLLLDQDQASRNASLGRIYNDLDFQRLGLVEGWSSVNQDPGNFSGHRLLSDTYASLPRHEIARVSELLQAQMLQPLNLTLIQPQLAVSNLGIISGAGPSALALNEFNPLFVSDGLALQTDAVGGGNGTLGDDLVLSGLQGKFAYSFGQFHYQTDGFRPNSDQQIDVYDLFLQASPTYSTSIQAEYRASDGENGDLRQRLSGFFDPTQRSKQEFRLQRLGLRHDFTAESTLLATLTHESLEEHGRFGGFNAPVQFNLDTQRDGYNLELQQLLRSERYDLVTGGGYITQDVDQLARFIFPFSTSSAPRNSSVEHGNLYCYSHFGPASTLIFTTGASADVLHGIQIDRDQVNPKLGLTWQPWPDLTLRAAAFRTLARTFIATQQTLEPTQVAGFNQFYNDAEATDAWSYGIAADKKFSPWLYTGIELAGRDLSVPLQAVNTRSTAPAVDFADWQEQTGRAYLYWLPLPWLAGNAEFSYERYQRDPDFPDRPDSYLDLRTRRLTLGVSAYSDTGLSGSLNATYVDQDSATFGHYRLSEQFWMVGGAIGYRLPKRYGQVSLEVMNLLDEHFNYEEVDPANPLFYPERLFLARFTLVL